MRARPIFTAFKTDNREYYCWCETSDCLNELQLKLQLKLQLLGLKSRFVTIYIGCFSPRLLHIKRMSVTFILRAR